MVKLNNLNPPPNLADNPGQQIPLNNQQQPAQKGLFQVPDKLLQLVPLIPFALEMLTGQKVPATGVLADILSGIQQNQANLTQILANQQQLWTKLESLENNASHQLTNLSQQLTSTNNNFRLLATETKRSLEFSPPKSELEPEY